MTAVSGANLSLSDSKNRQAKPALPRSGAARGVTYRALMRFADLRDGGHIYQAGETFPREGLTVSDERLHELLGSDNRAKKPLIVAVETQDDDAATGKRESGEKASAGDPEAEMKETEVARDPAKKRSRKRKAPDDDQKGDGDD